MKIDLDEIGKFYRNKRSGEFVELVEIEFSYDGKLAVYDWTNEQTGISGRRQCDYDIFMKLFSRVTDNENASSKMKIEKGKQYRLKENSDVHQELKKGTIVEVTGFEDGGVEFLIFGALSAVYNIERCMFENDFEEVESGGIEMIKAVYVELFREQLQKEIEIAQHEMEQAKGKIEGLRIALKNLDASHEKHAPDTEAEE